MSLSSFRSPRSPSGSRPIAGIVQEHGDPKATRLQEDCRHMIGTGLEHYRNILGRLPQHGWNIVGMFLPHSCHTVRIWPPSRSIDRVLNPLPWACLTPVQIPPRSRAKTLSQGHPIAATRAEPRGAGCRAERRYPVDLPQGVNPVLVLSPTTKHPPGDGPRRASSQYPVILKSKAGQF